MKSINRGLIPRLLIGTVFRPSMCRHPTLSLSLCQSKLRLLPQNPNLSLSPFLYLFRSLCRHLLRFLPNLLAPLLQLPLLLQLSLKQTLRQRLK